MEAAGPATERLERLETDRHQFEAEVQGLLLKADGKLKAASNAEARERQLKRSYERQFDPLAEDVDEVEAPARDTDISHNVEPSEAERLQAMRLVMETDDNTFAHRAKWGT